jgi:signal transduction histidine kinase
MQDFAPESMLTYSPEAAFFLTLFQFVLSGLSFAALLWICCWEKARARLQTSLIAAFVLLSVAFAGQAAYYRFGILPSGQLDPPFGWLLFLADAARLSASVALVAAYLLGDGRQTRLRVFLVVSLAMGLGTVTRIPGELTLALHSIDPLTTLRAADVATLAFGIVMLGSLRSLRAVALTLLALGRASAIPGALWPGATELWWSLGCVLVLVGLILLALTLERVSDRRLLHYVLRFNLIFLTLAASLMIVLTEIGRRQFVEFSALQIRDVAEFARGHLVYQTRLGTPPEQVLSQPEATLQLVREFGRYPDLRRAQLDLEGQTMALEINEAGEIDQQFWTGERPARPPVAPADFAEALLLQEQVQVDGRVVGRVDLFHSVLRINTRIGQQMQVAFVVFTLFVVAGSIVTGVLVHMADRTIGRQNLELATAQQRLLQSERLASIGVVANGVAHEINNPAGVLVARSDYLLSLTKDKPYSTEIKEDLETIRRQSQRIAKTVKDLLNSTRRARQARDPVDVGAVVQSAIKLVRPVVRDREVTFDFRARSTNLHVRGDRGRLEQVFINLLSNAAQAIPDRGAVTVEASVRPGGLWIDVSVADTGVGIKPDHLARVFEQFFTTKGPEDGSGLGLSIVHGIVNDHGGQIDVESTQGQGTEFRISLPAFVASSTPVDRDTVESVDG